MFLSCVAMSVLYSFQAIVLLNSCSKLFETLILLFIDNVTIGSENLLLFMEKFTPVTFGTASINAQFFVGETSSPTSQLSKG